MQRLYLLDCSPLYDEKRLADILPQIDADRQARVARLCDSKKRAQCAAAGVLLTRLFGRDNVPPPLFHGSRGKPYLYGRENEFFSISHSGQWVVCATAGAEIGADLQVNVVYNERVARRCLTPTEQDWLAKSPHERFALLWTAKEAYLKYTGFGLVLPMSSFTVPTPPKGYDKRNHCYWDHLTVNNSPLTICCGEEWRAVPKILSI